MPDGVIKWQVPNGTLTSKIPADAVKGENPAPLRAGTLLAYDRMIGKSMSKRITASGCDVYGGSVMVECTHSIIPNTRISKDNKYQVWPVDRSVKLTGQTAKDALADPDTFLQTMWDLQQERWEKERQEVLEKMSRKKKQEEEAKAITDPLAPGRRKVTRTPIKKSTRTPVKKQPVKIKRTPMKKAKRKPVKLD